MIHVNDQDFKGEVEQAFREAYMTHTSTSPNYQIIASLDVGRRQVELEGFEFVQKQIEAAMVMRGHVGIDGSTFKNQDLMDKYGIQVNKTSGNTVLFMTNIGTTRSSVAYLI
jgi:arginine/lysine/ornithine decarboxylase